MNVFLGFSPVPPWTTYLQLTDEVSTTESEPQRADSASAAAAVNPIGSQLPLPGGGAPLQIVSTTMHDWDEPAFLAPIEFVSRARYEQFVEPTNSKLLYFFIQQPQAPSDQQPGTIIRRPVSREQAYSSCFTSHYTYTTIN